MRSFRVSAMPHARHLRRARLRPASFLAVAALAAPTLAADRTWLSGFDDWSHANRWSPAGVPGLADRAVIGAAPGPVNGIVYLDMNAAVAALDVFGQARISTEGWRLQVNGVARIDGSGSNGGEDFFARLTVENGAAPVDFLADSLQVGTEGTLFMSGAPVVDIDGSATFAADTRLLGSGLLTVGGSFINGGETNAFGGDLTIDASAGNIDLDGSAGGGELIINDAGTDVELIANALTDAFDGLIFIGGSSSLTMSLDSPWTLASGSQLSAAWVQSDGHYSTILGAPLTLAGSVTVFGQSNTLRFQSPVTISPTANFDFYEIGADPANTLQFNNDATVNGGIFQIRAGAEVRFADTTVLNGGSFLLDEGAALNFNGPISVSAGDFATHSDAAADGAVLFNGPTTWNGQVFVLGIARQMGNATVNGPTTINARVFDMDGAGANWNIMNSLTVNAEAIDELSLPNAFNTQMTIGPNLLSRLTVNLDDPVYWQMNGQMTIIGDPLLYTTRVAGNTMLVGGSLSLTGGRAHIAPDLIFASGSTTTIPAGAALRVGGSTQIYVGANFAGSGTLRIAPSGYLDLYSGAGLGGVGVVNEGRFVVSLFPGIASVGRFENSPSGTFGVNIAGYAVGAEYDHLVVSPGAAVLGGHLHVTHYDLGPDVFVPEIGDEFTILTATDGVSGTFLENPTSCAAGRTFHWTVLYGPNDVRLRLDDISDCCPPDVNGDRQIDLIDLATLLSNFGLATGATQPMGDIDFDGDVDLTDLAILLTQFGIACS